LKNKQRKDLREGTAERRGRKLTHNKRRGALTLEGGKGMGKKGTRKKKGAKWMGSSFFLAEGSRNLGEEIRSWRVPSKKGPKRYVKRETKAAGKKK